MFYSARFGLAVRKGRAQAKFQDTTGGIAAASLPYAVGDLVLQNGQMAAYFSASHRLRSKPTTNDEHA